MVSYCIHSTKTNVYADSDSIKGKRDVKTITPVPASQTRITLVAAVTAGDARIPPFFILEGSRPDKNQVLLNGELKVLDVGAGWAFAENAFMTNEIWETSVVPHLVHSINRLRQERGKPHHPVLIVLDGYGAHTNTGHALQMCRENNIVVLKMPSHTSHALQPLDVSVFAPYKKTFKRTVVEYMRGTGQSPNKYVLAKIVNAAWNETLEFKGVTGETYAQVGMRRTNIHPFREDWIEANAELFAFVEQHNPHTIQNRCKTKHSSEILLF